MSPIQESFRVSLALEIARGVASVFKKWTKGLGAVKGPEEAVD